MWWGAFALIVYGRAWREHPLLLENLEIPAVFAVTGWRDQFSPLTLLIPQVQSTIWLQVWRGLFFPAPGELWARGRLCLGWNSTVYLQASVGCDQQPACLPGHCWWWVDTMSLLFLNRCFVFQKQFGLFSGCCWGLVVDGVRNKLHSADDCSCDVTFCRNCCGLHKGLHGSPGEFIYSSKNQCEIICHAQLPWEAGGGIISLSAVSWPSGERFASSCCYYQPLLWR